MPPAPVPVDEDARLAALLALRVMDSPAEPEFDALAKAAALVCDTPIALVSLVDAERQWFKARVGMPDVTQTSREFSFCAHALSGASLLEVADARADMRFSNNPLVVASPHIRFYAGAPLRMQDGTCVGTLCVMDSHPRQLSAQQRDSLSQLAIAVSRALETRRAEMSLQEQQSRMSELVKRQQQQYESTPALLYSVSVEGKFLGVSDRFLSWLGYGRDEVIGQRPSHFMTPESGHRARNIVFPEFLNTGVTENAPYQFVSKAGDVMDVLVSAVLVRDRQGRPSHSLSSVQDVTQRLRTENLLKSERSHLANIVKGTNAGTWEHDLVSGEDRVNDIYAAMLGYNVPEMVARLGANFFNIVHPDDHAHVDVRWNAHLEGRTPEYEAEFRAQHKEGHWVWILSRGRVGERDAGGRALNISGIHLDISSRRNAVDVATRAMRDLQNTLDALPSMVAYWDKDLRYRFANLAYGVRYGVRPDSLPGMHVSEILNPELYARNQPLIREALAGYEQSFEREVVDHLGNRRASAVRYVPDWEDGQVQGIYVFIFDITDIKDAQMALAHEREQLRNILEGTNAGTWQINLQTREAVINARWAEISGYSLEDFRGINFDSWRHMCHPDDQARIFEAFEAHLRGETEHYASQYRIRHRDGSWIWVQDRGKVSSRTAQGKPQWVSGTHLNAHDRVMAEIALHEQLQFVEVLLDATPTAIYLKDTQGRYLRFNKAFEDLFGIERSAWIGKHVLDLMGPPTGQAMHEKDLELFADGQSQTYEASFTNRRTGQPRVGLYYKAALRDAQGRITGLVGTILDVTERNKVARDLENAIAVAQAATEAKGRFLANMSHELRTPMNAVLGMLKLLQTTDLTTRQHDYASKTESAAKSLLGLLNDILDFSKLDAGKMELDPHPFRLDAMMRDLGVVLSSTLGNKTIEVLYDIDPALPEVVVGDAMRLRQVLINLGGNAVKFTQNGQVVVSVWRTGTHADGEPAAIEFAVTDSGIGIAPENLSRIFSGFAQAEASTTRRFGGTGLGLAISQRLVEMMGGEIGIESEVGRGSRFSFQLRLQVPVIIPEELRETKPRTAVAQRVLVVDDNRFSGELMAQATQSWGWPTQTATSGEQALALIASHSVAGQFPFDVVYVDWQMPGIDGWETTARIRALAQDMGQARPHIIMVTANGRESLSHRTAQEQAMLDGFLVKPVTASMLMDAVMNASPENLGIRSRRRSSRRQLAGMHILVVEDNLVNQQVAEELLASEGARVSLAADGRQGVNAVAQAQTPYDAVLMDIQMPVLDGYEATREIRALPGTEKLKIIGLTANAMASDREACLQAGMNEHMGKPFDLAQLVSMLIRLTGMRPAAALSGVRVTDAPMRPADAADMVLDLDAALARMSGLQSLYVRAAREFRGTLEDLEPRLGSLLQAPDLPAAAALLHSYKGTAATLGLVRLAQCIATLESQCKGGAEQALLVQQLPELRDELTQARQALGRALQTLGAGEEEPHPAPVLQQTPQAISDQDRAILLSLQQQLAASDLGALEQFAAVRDQLPSVAPAKLEQLELALQALDLPAALQICRALTA